MREFGETHFMFPDGSPRLSADDIGSIWLAEKSRQSSQSGATARGKIKLASQIDAVDSV
jgi:hypothetical protein